LPWTIVNSNPVYGLRGLCRYFDAHNW